MVILWRSKPKSIMLLSAELKHKKGSNNEKVTQAVKRYKQSCGHSVISLKPKLFLKVTGS